MRNIKKDKLAEILAKVKANSNNYSGVEEPSSPSLYSGWQVIDPVSQKRIGVRARLPFTEALELVGLPTDGMPSLPVWSTLLLDKSAGDYLEKVPELDRSMKPDFRHVLKILQVLGCQNRTGSGRGYYAFGEAGTSKTSTVLWVAAVLGLAVEQFNCSEATEVDDLFVRQIPDDGKWVSTEGALLRAVKHRWLCLVDEIDLAPPALPPALNDLIEGHAFSVPGYRDEVVKAGAGFHLFACGNTGFAGKEYGNYSGRNILDTSFKSRCIVDRYEPLSSAAIARIILDKYGEKEVNGVHQDFSMLAKALGEFTNKVNVVMKQEGIADTFSMRQISLFMDCFISSFGVMKYPLAYSLATAMPLMEEDEDFRQKCWNYFVSFFPGQANAKLEEVWEELYALA